VEDLLTFMLVLDDIGTIAIHSLRDDIGVSMVTMFDDPSTTAIRSIWEIVGVSVVGIFISITAPEVNGIMNMQMIRNIMSASMESILESTTITDCICTMVIEIDAPKPNNANNTCDKGLLHLCLVFRFPYISNITFVAFTGKSESS
jgi:hypothetical protein